ncbi:hypothetical protein [Cupriavidus taiwanensis]|uniref:hypothetical protein n=1 Tax=Cupriavidus taiwanensis TaxID=164546 RepID=UPI001F012ACD|nr:hypothetical protein [Cupriavidus taiwanensis]
MKDLLILGAGPFASLVRRYAELELGLRVVSFVVHREFQTRDFFESLPVLSPEDAQKRFPPSQACMFVAVGYRTMRGRETAYLAARQMGYRLANLICPSSYVAEDVALGDNNIVMPGVVIETGTKVGANNVIWSNATVCHESSIGSHNFIAANVTIGGGVVVGDKNFFGFSSVIAQRLQIGNETLIGALSWVNKSTQDLAQYHGSPARMVRKLDTKSGVTVSDA